MMDNILDIYHNLRGSWQIYREIISANYPKYLSAKGIAEFKAAANNNLFYQEDLVFTVNNYNIKSSKSYLYSFADCKNTIAKYFAIDKLFYCLNFGDSNNFATGQYLCNKDNYSAAYSFFDRTNFELIYTIKGPIKQMTIVSSYSKK